jgi:hypothetical protein
MVLAVAAKSATPFRLAAAEPLDSAAAPVLRIFVPIPTRTSGA